MPIQAHEIPCQEGAIGLVTLDAPDRLNALSAEMIEDFQTALENWAHSPRVCLVVIQGAGDRAFCAGGDVRQLYEALASDGDPEKAARYFAREYHLDYSLHRFPKPVVTLAHGAVMGGGLGLLSASRYRLITADTLMAMPEITIGLFPDVGASWFLNRLPGRLGLFLGLTGAHLNASDALRAGLADAVLRDKGPELIERLQEERWSGDCAIDDSRLYRLVQQLEHPDYRALPESNLARHEQAIARLSSGETLPEIVDQLLLAQEDSPWWQAAIKNLREGCPVTAWLVWTQLKKSRQMPLKDIFRMELAMASQCTRRPDFREGIRARLVDRDQSPHWSFASVSEVPEDIIDAHFLPKYDDDTDPMGLDSVFSQISAPA